jgi:xanthine dehydrogenase accessory factor
MDGSIGGGELEYWAQGVAEEILDGRRGSYVCEEKILGPDLGQCCGGRVEVMWQHVTEGADWWCEGNFLHLGDGGPRVGNEALGGMVNMSLLDDCREIWIFGGGHVGRMIARKSEGLGWRVVLVDERREYEGEEGCIYESDVLGYIGGEEMDKRSCVLVMTHSHERDYEIVSEVLRTKGSGYVGLIGSETKAARFRHRLARDGLGDELHRLRSPLGLEGVRGKERNAAEVAIAVWAELLQEESR